MRFKSGASFDGISTIWTPVFDLNHSSSDRSGVHFLRKSPKKVTKSDWVFNNGANLLLKAVTVFEGASSSVDQSPILDNQSIESKLEPKAFGSNIITGKSCLSPYETLYQRLM